MKSSKKIINVRFDEDKWEEVKKMAEKRGLSASGFVRQCVYNCLEDKKNEKKNF